MSRLNAATLIFDFDGTLHNTAVSYHKALAYGARAARSRGWGEISISRGQAESLLGCPPGEAWSRLAPGLDEVCRSELTALVGQEMDRLIVAGEGALYPQVHETLGYLQDAGYALYLLSNARVAYLQTALQAYGLTSYFCQAIAAESYDFAPKEKIIRELLPRLESPVVVVGDRHHDMQGALLNGLDCVFCSYGFGSAGEGAQATCRIGALQELRDLL